MGLAWSRRSCCWVRLSDKYLGQAWICADQTDSAPFIEFILRMILDAVTIIAPQVTPQVECLPMHCERVALPAELQPHVCL
jgi:hypothetical protein